MSTKRSITISIITVTYNAGDYIKPTIESVSNQDFASVEHLIIDGASTDNTLAIIDKDYKGKLISEPDQGVYDAMNKGLALAKGEYVLFLNAGDELALPTTLSDIFNTCNDADLIYGETIIINSDRAEIGTRTELTSRKLPTHLTKKDFLNGQVVSHQSFIPKRSICPSYDLKYSCSADIDWMLNIMNKAQKIRRSNSPISKYLQGGISDRNLKTCWKERFIIMLKHFNPIIVIFKHLQFVFRFLWIGAYRKA